MGVGGVVIAPKGINGYVGLKLVPNDTRSLSMFLSVIKGFPPLLSLFLPSYIFFFLHIAVIYSLTSSQFCLNTPFHASALSLPCFFFSFFFFKPNTPDSPISKFKNAMGANKSTHVLSQLHKLDKWVTLIFDN